MDAHALHQRARERGVNRALLLLAHLVLRPFFRLWFRLSRVGAEHVPAHGPVLLASNHRSFLDPFVIATCARRPMYFVAKQELFTRRWQAAVLNALGAFPVARGSSDQEMLTTARALLARGECVLIFPEGTRVRPGGLGTPRRGVGRLALESGAPVVPVALVGTEHVRRGWRIRPRRVTIRVGRPLTFPRVDDPSKALAQAVTERIWPCVALQWEWLGGLAPLRRAAVIGAGAYGTSLALALRRAGLEVELGTRTRAQAEAIADAKENALHLPGHRLEGITVVRASELALDRADVVVLAVGARDLPHVLAAHGDRIAARSGVVTVAKGLVGPLGTLPSAFAAERVRARAVACLGGTARAGTEHGLVVVAAPDQTFAAQLVQVLRAAGLDAQRSRDVTGVELAGIASGVAALAAAVTASSGPAAAGAAAGRVLAELHAHALRAGARAESLDGPAGTGDLVGTLLARETSLGQACDARDTVALLAARLDRADEAHRAIDDLAALTTGDPDDHARLGWSRAGHDPQAAAR